MTKKSKWEPTQIQQEEWWIVYQQERLKNKEITEQEYDYSMKRYHDTDTLESVKKQDGGMIYG